MKIKYLDEFENSFCDNNKKYTVEHLETFILKRMNEGGIEKKQQILINVVAKLLESAAEKGSIDMEQLIYLIEDEDVMGIPELVKD